MKALFFDIDGTIWDRHNNIPESARKAIAQARENGHKAFICSGRTRGYIQNEDLLGIGFDGIVSGCGTMIEMNGETVFSADIPADLAISTVETVRRFGFRPILEGREYLYMEESEFGHDPYGQKLFRELKDRRKPIDQLWGQWSMSKLSCATDGCETQECFKILSRYYDMIVHNSAVVEMVPHGYNKGTGLRHACDLMGIDVKDSVAFGDSVNDLDMFRTAGFAVAMGNGSDEAKDASDYVSSSLHDDGISKALTYLNII